MSEAVLALEEEADLPPPPELSSAMAVLRRALRETPELRQGIVYTLVFAMISGFGQLLVPILIQQILDKGFTGPNGFRPGFVFPACGAAGVAVIGVYLASRTSFARMVRASENSLFSMRVRVFNHIHKLSLAEQTARRKGAYVARVTADMDTLSQFMEWGALHWIVSSALMVTTVAVMLVYSWQLTLLTLFIVSPLTLVLRVMQRGMLRAYDQLRTRVSDTMSEVSESLMGVAVVRAYGVEEHIDKRIKTAIGNQYRAQVHANKFGAAIFPISDVFGALAVAVVLVVGALYGPRMGLSLGQVVAFLPGDLVSRPHGGDLGDFRPDPDRDRGLAQDPLRSRPTGRDQGTGDGDDPASWPLAGAKRRPQLRLSRGGWSCARSALRSRPAATSRSWARPAPARPRSRSCSAASPTPPRVRSWLALSISAKSRRRPAAKPSG